MEFIGQLYPFQQQVLEWMQEHKSGILGMDMGLGKTVVTLAFLCHSTTQYEHTLILVPLSLIDQWFRACHQFTNLSGDQIVIYHGSNRQHKNISGARIIFTTYEVIRRDMSDVNSLLSRNQQLFDCLVLDEAHQIRNSKTKLFKMCTSIGSKYIHKWLLTGTTIYNQIDDFKSLCTFLNLTISEGRECYYHLSKTQCSDLHLPEKRKYQHYLNFDSNHLEWYTDVCAEVKEYYTRYLVEPNGYNYKCVLEKILRLRQCCNHPNAMLSAQFYQIEKNRYPIMKSSKFEFIYQIISSSPHADKLIIFSQWTHSLHLLKQYLNSHSIDCLEYTGDLSSSQKMRVLDQFKTSNEFRVLLMTITSGGVGLDLHCANHVMLLDSCWNDAIENQAIDRVYRIGQHKTVEVHYFLMCNTIEEWMIELQRQKTLVNDHFHQDGKIYLSKQNILRQLLPRYI